MDYLELPENELAALQNAEFFRQKARVDDKIKELFSDCKQRIAEITAGADLMIPGGLLATPGRTFRGENHHGFPWRALDAPRQSRNPELFIFRTLLLWGHHFSCHLLLDGPWQQQYAPRLTSLAPTPWRLDTQADPWNWLPSPADLKPISETNLALEMARSKPLKISCFYSLELFSQMPQQSAAAWHSVAQALFSTPPN